MIYKNKQLEERVFWRRNWKAIIIAYFLLGMILGVNIGIWMTV